jgi:hypothetical protein
MHFNPCCYRRSLIFSTAYLKYCQELALRKGTNYSNGLFTTVIAELTGRAHGPLHSVVVASFFHNWHELRIIIIQMSMEHLNNNHKLFMVNTHFLNFGTTHTPTRGHKGARPYHLTQCFVRFSRRNKTFF